MACMLKRNYNAATDPSHQNSTIHGFALLVIVSHSALPHLTMMDNAPYIVENTRVHGCKIPGRYHQSIQLCWSLLVVSLSSNPETNDVHNGMPFTYINRIPRLCLSPNRGW